MRKLLELLGLKQRIETVNEGRHPSGAEQPSPAVAETVAVEPSAQPQEAPVPDAPPQTPGLIGRMPRSGEQCLYVEASEIDVASVVRGIDGVQKVTRESGGIWRIVTDRDISAEAARKIVGKGGGLNLLLSSSQLSRLGLLPGERA